MSVGYVHVGVIKRNIMNEARSVLLINGRNARSYEKNIERDRTVMVDNILA